MELHERLSSTNPRNTGEITSARDPFTDVKNRIHLALVSELGPQLLDVDDSGSERSRVTSEISARLQQEQQLSHDDRERLTREIADDVFGYGPLEQLLGDSTISEVMVNGPDDIWIER